eukprot:scaffold6778_cov129-Isochrysis_galbana.AAC.5
MNFSALELIKRITRARRPAMPTYGRRCNLVRRRALSQSRHTLSMLPDCALAGSLRGVRLRVVREHGPMVVGDEEPDAYCENE